MLVCINQDCHKIDQRNQENVREIKEKSGNFGKFSEKLKFLLLKKFNTYTLYL